MKQNSKKKTSTAGLLIFAVVLIILFLSLPIIIRLVNSNPLFPAGESYYNLHIAQALKQDLFLNKDPVQGTSYQSNPYHYFLAILFIILPVETVSLFLPLLLGVLSGLVFFKLLRLVGIKNKEAAFSIIILSITPAFIILFTGLYLLGFVVFLSLLSILLVLQNKKSYYALIILLFILLALTSLTGFLLSILIILFLCLVLKKKARMLFIPVTFSVLVIVLLLIFTDYTPWLLGFHSFAFTEILSLLQAGLGFDIFLIVLFLTGFVIVWINAKQEKLFHLVVLGLFILSLFNIVARAFTSFIISIYCVAVITYFYRRKWELKVIRGAILFLVLCSLIFSVINQINLLVDSQPDKTMQDALVFFKSLDKGKVLTSQENGFMVELYSQKEVLLDANSYLFQDYLELKNISNVLFQTPRLTQAEPFFKDLDLKYIFITPSMKEELWENREQGLWFLVMNSDSFIKKYNQNKIEIWEYKD